MACARSKTSVLIQLSVLLATFLAALATPISPAPSPAHHHHHHHHHTSPSPSPSPSSAPTPAHHHHHHTSPSPAPAPAPGLHHHHAHPPSHAPAESPMHPPAYPPHAHMQRSFVAVQGVVYCKPCKNSGVTPILGAGVKLACNNTNKRPTIEQAKTDKNGYFFINAPKTVTSYAFHKCSVTLVSSPVGNCSYPTDLHGGIKGAMLRPEKPFVSNKLPFVLYSVGPLAFAPKCY